MGETVCLADPGERAISREQAFVLLYRLDEVDAQLDHLRHGVPRLGLGGRPRVTSSMPNEIKWVDGETCEIGGLRFATVGTPASIDEGLRRVLGLGLCRSTANLFVLLKTRAMIDQYAEVVAELHPERIFQLGIFQGGSVAMLSELARPERLAAIDLSADRVPVLDGYIADRGLGDVVQPHYAVDQGDADTIRALATDLGGPLDLVADDASHVLDPTRASVEALFPLLRPGGLYIIEDWSQGDDLVEDPALQELLRSRGPSLEAIVHQFVSLCASNPEIVADVRIMLEMVVVRRGDGPIGPAFLSLL
jgi:predicted O-methyltransferase YrrM